VILELIVSPIGVTRCLYGEAIPLSALGRLSISRGSYVEPTLEGQWTADMAPVGGPVLGPFPERSEALAAEVEWLTEHWLRR